MPSVDRAITLVEAVAATSPGLTAGALGDVVTGSRSGMYALLHTLRQRGWITRDHAGHYVPGPALVRLAVPHDHDETTLRLALDDSIREHGPDESVALVRSHDGGNVVVASHDGAATVRCIYPVGARRTGPTADVVAMRPSPSSGPGDHNLDAGVACTEDPEVVEVAAPVCRDGRLPIAVVLAGIPRQRASAGHVADVGDAVRAIARDLSLRLGAPDWQPWGRGTQGVVGPPRILDDTEVASVLRGRHRAQLACLRDDGTPHVVPLWFHWDGATLWLTASPGAAWAGYVGSGCRVSLTIEEPRPDLHRVFLSGWAAPVDDATVAGAVAGGIDGLRARMLDRYVGREPGGGRADQGDSAGWTAIRVVPERLHGRAGLAGVAP